LVLTSASIRVIERYPARTELKWESRTKPEVGY
jgi:hypothetical protein